MAARKSLLLFGSALTSVMAPLAASAQCIPGPIQQSGAGVICATTNTIDTSSSNVDSSARNLVLDSTVTSLSVASGATIGGFGLAIETTGAPNLSVVNDGVVQVDSENFASAGGSDAAFAVSARSNTFLNYSGTGNVT